MQKPLAASVICSFLVVSGCSAALAASPDPTTRHLQSMIRQLKAANAPNPAATLATVTRSATIIVKVTITSASDSTAPSNCDVSIAGYSGLESFSEEVTKAASVQGNTGTCTVPIHFRWAGVDDTGQIEVELSVHGSDPSYRQTEVERQIPLPAEGSTVTHNFAVVM